MCRRILNSVFVFLLIIASPVMLFAQTGAGEPCSDNDPLDNSCPLDTWVIVLAFVAVAFAAFHLHRKQQRSKMA